MIIDNKLTTAKLKILFILLLSLSLIFVLYVYLEHGIERNHIMSGLAALLFTGYLIMHSLNLYYFYFDARGNKLIFRFYHVHPFIRKPKAIEIPKTMLSGYYIASSFFNLKRSITLIQRTPTGVFEYPPISISAISKEEQSRLERTLNQIIIENSKKRQKK